MIAESAMFVAGTVPGLADAPPDCTDEEENVVEQLASWDSAFMPSSAVFLDPVGAS